MSDSILKEDIKYLEVSYLKAIQELVPNSLFSISGNDLNTLVWDDDNTESQPSNSDIIAKYNELDSNWDSTEEPRTDRKLEYPALEEQLDKLFHDIDEGKLDKTGSFYTALKAIKDAHPKG